MILTGNVRMAGVLGWPVAHSRSPRLHNYWLNQYGIDGAYLPLPVKPEDFETVLRCLPRMGFVGCNITVPHKEAAFAVADERDESSRRIGAVNTIYFTPRGRLIGSNTDSFGFLENLRAGAPEWHASAGPAVVIGAGGAARALIVALIDQGVPELRLVNRTPARSERLAADLGGPISVIEWDKRAEALDGAAFLVNATTQGMVGQPPLDLDLAHLPKTALVNDIVYMPLETPLLLAAHARGNPIVDGLGMLLHQGRPGFKAWFGREPEITPELRRFVLEGPVE